MKQVSINIINPVIKISHLKPYTNKKGETQAGCCPVDSDLYTELLDIKQEKYKSIVEEGRAISDDAKRKEFKQAHLPSFAVSAVLQEYKKGGWRDAKHLLYHTGMLQGDLDGKQNPHIKNWELVRDELFKLDFIVSSWITYSKNGVAFIVKINPKKHAQTFTYLSDYFSEVWGLKLDPACKDVVRQRYTSSDPGAKIKFDFEKIKVVEPTNEWVKQQVDREPLPAIIVTGVADNEINFLNAMERVESSSKSFPFEDGSKYFYLRQLAAFCNLMGISLAFTEEMVIKHYGERTEISTADLLKPIRGIYRTYTHQHGTYETFNRKNKRAEDLKWFIVKKYLHEGAKPSDDELSLLAAEFELNLIDCQFICQTVFQDMRNEFGYKNYHKFRKVKLHLAKKWEFRKNVVSEQLENRELGTTEWIQINLNTLYCYLNESKRQSIKKDDIRSILESDWVIQYDPFLDFFESLANDDSVDWIDKLAGYIQCTNQLFWRVQFKKALVRSIACGLGQKENRILMVLQGDKQNTGKSTFIRSLCPWQGTKYYTESSVAGNPKDVALRLCENFIWNVEELEGMFKKDLNSFKALVSGATIKERRPYGSFETARRRRVNFWASTNPKGMLQDTENTRWLIFEVQNISWAYSNDIDINKVWAQAYHLYKTGFNYQLTRTESLIQSRLNEEFRIVKPEEELLSLNFEKSDKGEGEFLSASEIAIELSSGYTGLKISPIVIGRAMMKVFGVKSELNRLGGPKNLRGYWLIKRDKSPENASILSAAQDFGTDAHNPEEL